MIKSKKLSKFKQLSHGFFNRKGGTSKGIYSSLNCGVGSNDSKKSIKNNLRIVCKKIGTPSKKLILLNQIHSNKFYYIDKNYSFNKKRLIGDALITKIKKVSLGILTADCAPILFYDKVSKIIGLSDDIARNTSSVSTRVSIIPGKNTVGIEIPNEKRDNVILS